MNGPYRQQISDLILRSGVFYSSSGMAVIRTMACACGGSSVIVRWISARIPGGVIFSSCAYAPPVNAIVGLPDGRLITPISRQKTPRRNPVPSAFEQASFAA